MDISPSHTPLSGSPSSDSTFIHTPPSEHDSEGWWFARPPLGDPHAAFDPTDYDEPQQRLPQPDLPAPVTPVHLIRPNGTGAILAFVESIERGRMLWEDKRLLEQMREAWENARMRAEDYPEWYLISIMD